MILQTPRLILEPIAEAHFEDFVRLRSDPVVMTQMMGGAETREETCATFAAYQESWARVVGQFEFLEPSLPIQ